MISHPLGKSFIGVIKKGTPFPLDDFPEGAEAETLLRPFGFSTKSFIDEPELYILVAEKENLIGDRRLRSRKASGANHT